MFSSVFFRGITFLSIFLLCFSSSFLEAEVRKVNKKSGINLSSNAIKIPAGLEGRVEFWILVFTTYSKDHRVFHNRLHPEVIYSSLDFSEYEKTLSGSTLKNAKLAEAEAETEKIRRTLVHLGGGNRPRNDFERRVEKAYKSVPGHSLARYREGAEEDVIRYQTGIRERFRDGLVRSGRYLEAIEHIFEEQGLPRELGRVPLVESSFDYTAYSSVGAAGIWQFMPATGRRYMTVNSNIDERRDPIVATRAAAQYLKNAYEDTGVWSLAVTSYNHGLSGIIKAMRTVGSTDIVKIINNYEAKSFGFASSNFYAEFLAALIVEQNAERYFPGIVRESPIEFDEIRVPKSLSFRNLISLSGVAREELQDLNLSFSKTITDGRVNIPAGTLIKVPHRVGRSIVAKLPGARVLASSADFSKRRNITAHKEETTEVPEPVELVSLYDGKSQKELELGEEISAHSKINTEVLDNKPSREKKIVEKKQVAPTKVESYTVKKGDTLGALSRKFKLGEKELMKRLKIASPKKLKPGMTLKF